AVAEQGYALCNLGTSLAFMGRVSEGTVYLAQARQIAEQSGNHEELTRTLVCLAAVLLYEAGRLDEAAAVALEAAAIARQSGVFRLVGAMAVAYAADAYLRLGRWDECDQLTADPDLFDAPPPMAVQVHLVRAELEMRRGRFNEAQALIGAADALSAGMPEAKNRGYYLLRRAELAMWHQRYDDVRKAVHDGLALVAVADNQDRFGPEMCAIGVRAEADRETIRAGPDHLGRASSVRQIAVELVSQARAITRHSLDRATVPAPDASAFAIMCEAELSRLDRAGNPDAWAAAILAWGVAGQPYQSAYCRYRFAEATLVSRQSAKTATTALAEALQVAHSLRAAPLIAEIDRLVTRAHLDLPSATASTKTVPNDGIERLGLTAREAEVLHLLATGQTNSQIASTLFISEKTASVHVSNILRKLDVRSRLEAAAVAQRLLDNPK
ncbi:MAG TPA: LuxR C-terminal-related transcriptional regulator, partial [Acidimicrobiales bacterium]|nr:LuxR C-terminal-related transcriptional regulator [Acidimicrobiales bacterium]